jgi:hypothetical protein
LRRAAAPFTWALADPKIEQDLPKMGQVRKRYLQFDYACVRESALRDSLC